MHEFLQRLKQHHENGVVTDRQVEILQQFYRTYTQAYIDSGREVLESPAITLTFLERIVSEIKDPYPFSCYHEHSLKPFNYLEFGIHMIRPLVDKTRSQLLGLENFDHAKKELAKGHNCIWFANHQSEADPQALHVLLEEHYEAMASEIIFVAGERVIADPIAVPFSQGRNMLCIHSKKHHDDEGKDRTDRQLHNRRAMQELVAQLAQGGKCVYVAPSGGRDRADTSGRVRLAPADPQAIDMFCLLARQAKVPTNFYPLTLATHRLLPPPPVVEQEIGENREFFYTAIGATLGKAIDWKAISGIKDLDKRQQRQRRADFLMEQLQDSYNHLVKLLPDEVTRVQTDQANTPS